MGLGNFNIQTEIDMKENGKKDKDRDWVFYLIPMVTRIPANGC